MDLAPLAPTLVLIGIFFIAMALVGRSLRLSPNGGLTVRAHGRVRWWQLVAAILVLLLGLNYLEGLDRPERGRQRRIPVFVVDASRMPHVAAHIQFAWKLSPPKPRLLHRADALQGRANRRVACADAPPPIQPDDPECDEYPFATTLEGGRGASIAPVPPVENRRQGGALSAFYRKEGVRVGDPFRVRVKGDPKRYLPNGTSADPRTWSWR
jgi:Deoxyribonuclease NucA/NucB